MFQVKKKLTIYEYPFEHMQGTFILNYAYLKRSSGCFGSHKKGS